MQDKTITVINLNQRPVNPKPGGKVFTPFIAYEIFGNDGIKYQTLFKEVNDRFEIGKTIDIKYTIETKTVGSRIFTSYNLVPPPKRTAAPSGEGMVQIGTKLDEILSLLRKAVIKVDIEAKTYPPEKNIADDISYPDDDDTPGPRY
jgi:hypothetical protein